ncbi:MAG: S41 family peptidase [Chlorobiaceae bacterium]|nr:S41 family peptidase [Chlorobiaceae bacterium]MBA4308988.1 S41 family peptidase [Chlorobiaceae bacterium]
MHKKKIKYIVLSLSLVLFSGFFFVTKDLYFEIGKNIDIFTRVYKEITFNYVDEIDPEKFLRAGIQGMLSTLDPYTVFIDEKRKDDIDLITTGKYGGIGVSIGIREKQVVIVEVMDGHSAQRQGVRIGDVIIKVDDLNVSDENFEEVSPRVKGEPGTYLNLKVVRNEANDTINFSLVREEIAIKNIPFYGFYPENSNNVYIRLIGFNRSAGAELRNALQELKAQKEIKSIVLDLRGNPGGLLDVAVDISNQFLKSGDLIVSTKGRDSVSIRHYYATQEPLLQNNRLVILVNEGSASASEIVAGAIQDHDRGVIVGTKSFGKGLVQTIVPLSFNTSLKITTSKYFTPSGRSIQRIDYSKENNVIVNQDSIIPTPFSTDNHRKVFSGGGIAPDSVVKLNDYSEIVKDLLAKGIIFKFANQFYESNTAINFSQINDEKMFLELEQFLKREKYRYESDLEKKINEVAVLTAQNKVYSEFNSRINSLKNDIKDLTQAYLKESKQEVIREIREELASRYLGTAGRIKEILSSDNQFLIALDILKYENIYNKILNK